MYIILEIQTNKGVTSVLPAITKTNRNEADQAYYQILAAAAVSSVEIHSAVILTEAGAAIASKSYDHTSEVVS